MARYVNTYKNTVTGETYTIQANDPYTFQNKLNALNAKWEKQNARILENQQKDKAIANAELQTKEALKAIEDCKSILKYTLEVDDKIDWEVLKQSKTLPVQPRLEDYLRNVPKKTIFEVFEFQRKNREKAEEQAKSSYQEAYNSWTKLEENRQNYVKEMDDLKSKYESIDPSSVEKYISLVLERSKYPEFIDLVPEVLYEPNSKIAFIEITLPNPEKLPSIIEYK